MELSALIFAKSMRKKDVKGASKSKTEEGEANGDSTENGKLDVESISSSVTAKDDDDRSEAMKQTRQGVVNLGQ